MSGQVVHFEIPADDVERACGFYRDAFGWQINSMPEMDYSMVSTTATDRNGRPTEPGAINGGLLTRQAPLASPVITINVDDITEALVRVEQLGGRTVRDRQAISDLGFSAYFTDPEGNLLGLWEAAG